MTTLEALEALKKRLQERGWCQGRLGEADGPNCITGALRIVLGQDMVSPTMKWIEESQKLWEDTLGALHFTPSMRVHRMTSVTQFNDYVGTTVEHVMQMIDEAIAAEQMRAP